ncbi:MAG: M48 family metallopeptidase [Kordiimonadaceae bacterium]|nr:M48 family metallopeptidase [Kordiimonadaceae bacterium]
MRRLLVGSVFALSAMAISSTEASAQSLLRDAETEAFLHHISEPIFLAAGLTPASVKIYLINDSSLNAFVTGGQNIFIHSGLIKSSKTVDQLLGVIAHETGHIAGGHGLSRKDAFASAGNLTILSLVLGAAAIVAGSPDAGLGLFGIGQSAARGQILSYTRSQESTADQAGAKYLEKSGISTRGLIEFFDLLRDQEILAQIRQNPYVRTHPINRTRILSLQNNAEKSPYYNRPPDAQDEEAFSRIKAKLSGYLSKPRQTLRDYPVSDKSMAARYARVYGYHRALEWDLALEEANHLIAAEPNNPFFYEIKGQILFENGKVEESLPIFQQAVSLAPEQSLISTALGQAMVSLEDTEMMLRAIPILKNAVRRDPENGFAWFNLAKAYSWTEQIDLANLATAERFYSGGNAIQASIHARRALDAFKEGTRDWIRAQDILFVTEREAAKQLKRQKRRRRRLGIGENEVEPVQGFQITRGPITQEQRLTKEDKFRKKLQPKDNQ